MDEAKKAICDTIPNHLREIAAKMDSIQVSPVNANDPIPEFIGGGFVIPGVPEFRVAKLTSEFVEDLDVFVKTLMDMAKSEGEAEVMMSLMVDCKTGELKRAYPVIRGGHFVQLKIQTGDGFKTYGEICREHEKDLYAPLYALHDANKDGGEKEPTEN